MGHKRKIWFNFLWIDWFEWHHLYLGLMMLAAGIALILSGKWILGGILALIGLILVMDDIYQHHRQVKDRNYHSILHVLYGKLLYKYPLIQRLNRWADKFMAKLRR